jgi:hypothetical protein
MLSSSVVKEGLLNHGKKFRSQPKDRLGIITHYEVYRLRGEWVMDMFENGLLKDTDDEFDSFDELYEDMCAVSKEWKATK